LVGAERRGAEDRASGVDVGRVRLARARLACLEGLANARLDLR
jgi:hypothetical protein